MSGELHALVAVLVLTVAYWRKIPIEERTLRTTFASDWDDYRHSSWALISGLFRAPRPRHASRPPAHALRKPAARRIFPVSSAPGKTPPPRIRCREAAARSHPPPSLPS